MACIRLVAWAQTRLWRPSMTADEISSPRTRGETMEDDDVG